MVITNRQFKKNVFQRKKRTDVCACACDPPSQNIKNGMTLKALFVCVFSSYTEIAGHMFNCTYMALGLNQPSVSPAVCTLVCVCACVRVVSRDLSSRLLGDT